MENIDNTGVPRCAFKSGHVVVKDGTGASNQCVRGDMPEQHWPQNILNVFLRAKGDERDHHGHLHTVLGASTTVAP
jgi:hypothetical protein